MTKFLLGLLAGLIAGAAAGFALGLRTEFFSEEEAQLRDRHFGDDDFEVLMCNQRGDLN